MLRTTVYVHRESGNCWISRQSSRLRLGYPVPSAPCFRTQEAYSRKQARRVYLFWGLTRDAVLCDTAEKVYKLTREANKQWLEMP